MKYIIEDTLPCFVTFRYSVEANSKEEALAKYREDETTYIDNEIGDNLDFAESSIEILEDE